MNDRIVRPGPNVSLTFDGPIEEVMILALKTLDVQMKLEVIEIISEELAPYAFIEDMKSLDFPNVNVSCSVSGIDESLVFSIETIDLEEKIMLIAYSAEKFIGKLGKRLQKKYDTLGVDNFNWALFVPVNFDDQAQSSPSYFVNCSFDEWTREDYAMELKRIILEQRDK